MFILTKEQSKNADKYSQEGLGLYGEILMENAGQAFSIALANHIKLNSKHRFHIFCGRGNNGGDGIVLARRLKQLGHKTRLIFVDGVDEFSAAAAYHFKVYCNCGFDYELFNLFLTSLIIIILLLLTQFLEQVFTANLMIKRPKFSKKLIHHQQLLFRLMCPAGFVLMKAILKRQLKLI